MFEPARQNRLCTVRLGPLFDSFDCTTINIIQASSLCSTFFRFIVYIIQYVLYNLCLFTVYSLLTIIIRNSLATYPRLREPSQLMINFSSTEWLSDNHATELVPCPIINQSSSITLILKFVPACGYICHAVLAINFATYLDLVYPLHLHLHCIKLRIKF